jgi:hypothetical protein
MDVRVSNTYKDKDITMEMEAFLPLLLATYWSSFIIYVGPQMTRWVNAGLPGQQTSSASAMQSPVE